MANNNSNRKLVPEAQSALERFKYEVASDMCVKNIFTLISTSYFILLFMLFSFLILSSHLIH